MIRLRLVAESPVAEIRADLETVWDQQALPEPARALVAGAGCCTGAPRWPTSWWRLDTGGAAGKPAASPG